MAGAVLLGRADIEDGDLAALHAAHELIPLDSLHRSARFEVLARDLIDLGESRLREPPEREEEAADLVVREAVLDVQALLLCVDESSGAQHLEVLRSIGDGDGGLLGECLDGARALAEQIQQLEPLGRRDGFPEPGELLVDGVLEPPMGRRHAVKYSTAYLNCQE